MKIKLLSTWFGCLPMWHAAYAAQMSQFDSVDWELLPGPDVKAWTGDEARGQLNWYNERASWTFEFPTKKDLGSICDLRPAWGHIFEEKVAGYDWWGWIDMDMCVGDLDRLLPPLMRGCDVLSFKQHNLSGCFTIMRNTEPLRLLYRSSERWKEVMADQRYHCWDESGYRHIPGESFHKVIMDVGVLLNSAPGWYDYDTRNDLRRVERRGKGLFDLDSGEELLFLHFMSDTWPLTPEGRSIWAK